MDEDGDGDGDDVSSPTSSAVRSRSSSSSSGNGNGGVGSSSSSSGDGSSSSSGGSAAERDQEVEAARAALDAARLVVAAAEQRYARAVQQQDQGCEEEDGASARSARSSVSGGAAAQRDNDLIKVLPTLAAFLDSLSTAPVVALAYKTGGVVTVLEHALDVEVGLTSFCGILGKFFRDSIQQDDPLTRLLYAASTGDAKGRGGASPAPGDAVGLARSVHAAQVAAEVVRSVADPSGTWLTQDLVGTLTQDAALPTRIRNKLIKLALSTSQKTIVERRTEGIDAMGDPVAKLPPWSLRILMADNVGFQCMKTYEQFVALAILVVPYDVLVKLDVIAASKVPRSLATELPDAASYLARTIDYGCLAFRTADRPKSLLASTDLFDDDGAVNEAATVPQDAARRARANQLAEDAAEGDLFRSCAATDDAGDGAGASGADYLDDDALDAAKTYSHASTEGGDEGGGDEEDDEYGLDARAAHESQQRAIAAADLGSDEAIEAAAGALARGAKAPRDGKYENQEGPVVMDTPMHLYLGLKETAWKVLMRAVEVAGFARAGLNDSGCAPAASEPGGEPNCGLPPFLVVDGGPQFDAEGMMAERPDVTKGLVFGDAAFHLEKELYTALSKLLDRAFLRYFCCCMGRTGLKGQDWVLYPGDPRQARQEWLEMMLGVQAEVVREARLQHGPGVTVLQIHDFMLARAARLPVVTLVVLWMRYLEVTTMILDSRRIGENGDYDPFRSARPLAQSLFASTNCYRYVLLGATMEEQWAGASDAARMVLEKIIFTRQSATGKGLAAADEYVEWIINDIRAVLGKHYTFGREAHIVRVIFQLPEIIGSLRSPPSTTAPTTAPLPRKKPNCDARGAPRPVMTFKAAAPAFKAGVDLARLHGLWDQGPVKYKTRTGKYLAAEGPANEGGKFFALDGGDELNLRLLLVVEDGTRRLLKFYAERCARRAYAGGASDDGTPPVGEPPPTRFPTVPALFDDVEERHTFEASRRIEVVPHRLKKTFPGVIGKGKPLLDVLTITAELDEWRAVQHAHRDGRGVFVYGVPERLPTTKDELCDLLGPVRKEMFAYKYKPRTVAPEPTTSRTGLVYQQLCRSYGVDVLDAKGVRTRFSKPYEHPLIALPGLDSTAAATFSASQPQAPPPAKTAASPAAASDFLDLSDADDWPADAGRSA
ncbi:hypothetical protein M885DRAFT_575657 [Pelagophyceae sp. CCMP2097]|nr:hypothetical protein M885DRAFT_575657 [Pelagophyceae sp. CCMP2097]